MLQWIFGKIMECKTWVTIEAWRHILVQTVLDAAHCFRNPHMTHDMSGRGATRRLSQSVPLFLDTGDLYLENQYHHSNHFHHCCSYNIATELSTDAEFAYMEMERWRLHLFTWQTLLSKMDTGNDSSARLSSWGERSSSGSHDAQLALWNLSKTPVPPASYIRNVLYPLCSGTAQNVPAVLYPHLQKRSSIISERDRFYGSHTAGF